MAGEDAVGKAAFEGCRRLRRIQPAEPAKCLIGTLRVGHIERRRNHERLTRRDFRKLDHNVDGIGVSPSRPAFMTPRPGHPTRDYPGYWQCYAPSQPERIVSSLVSPR